MKLTELIDIYGAQDESYKALGKQVEDKKSQIKEKLCEMKATKLAGSSYEVSYTVQRRESFDEAQLLLGIKNLFGDDECPYIKTIEVVDMDAIESALYHETLPIEVRAKMLECMRVKESPTLHVSKIRRR